MPSASTPTSNRFFGAHHNERSSLPSSFFLPAVSNESVVADNAVPAESEVTGSTNVASTSAATSVPYADFRDDTSGDLDENVADSDGADDGAIIGSLPFHGNVVINSSDCAIEMQDMQQSSVADDAGLAIGGNDGAVSSHEAQHGSHDMAPFAADEIDHDIITDQNGTTEAN